MNDIIKAAAPLSAIMLLSTRSARAQQQPIVPAQPPSISMSSAAPTPGLAEPRESGPILPGLEKHAEEKQSFPLAMILHPRRNGMLVTLPMMDTDPNRGITYGVMPIWIITEPGSDRIKQIYAPSITNNKNFGVTPTYRYYYYPSETADLNVIAAISQRRERELLGEYNNSNFLAKEGLVHGRAHFNIDGSGRFFGIGPNTSVKNESNFTRKTIEYYLQAGLPVVPGSHWKFNVGHRMAGETISGGVIEEVPSITDIPACDPSVDPNCSCDPITGVCSITAQSVRPRFPGTQNISGVDKIFADEVPDHAHQDSEVQLFADYDTRDSALTTSQGTYLQFYYETAQRPLASEFIFNRYVAQLREFIKPGESSSVTAFHFRYEQLAGTVPFYLLPVLGGKTIHRGYGAGRFVDHCMVTSTLEERFTVLKVPTAGVNTEFEIAPFTGVGSVARRTDTFTSRYLRPVIGIAARAIARPQIVGSVDFGYGQEGLKVFMDIDYPF